MRNHSHSRHTRARKAGHSGCRPRSRKAAALVTLPTVDDRDELLRSARKLSQRDLDALLLCDGEPVMSGGKERLAESVSAAGLG
jgi:hypothetical protein